MKGLYHQMQRMSEEVQAEVRQAVSDSLEAIKTDAVSFVPVDTGKLRDNIRIDLQKSGFRGSVIAGGKGTSHANLVEYGTYKTKAQPFLTPAFEAEKPKFEARVARAVRKATT